MLKHVEIGMFYEHPEKLPSLNLKYNHCLSKFGFFIFSEMC